MVYGALYGVFDLSDGGNGVSVSEISSESDRGCIFRIFLCGSDALLYLSDPGASGRDFYGLARIYLCMGM